MSNKFIDPRDGQVYSTVELNGQIWLAENFNYDVGEECCFYDHNPANEEIFGRLYTWEAAIKACPPGWRLPENKEWDKLTDFYGSPDGAYNVLIEGGSSGFNALLGGYRSTTGFFLGLNVGGYYWSAMNSILGFAYSYNFYSNSQVLYRFDYNLSNGLSVRYIKNQ